MFARGPRFDLTKVPEVPAPNAYNVQLESALDNYKRGAFLEKADRFSKEKAEAAQETRKGSPSQAAPEQYVTLQKRVDELQKVHLEAKRAHQVELEKLKQELATSQKHAAENTDKFEKLKKQKATLDLTIQELKKASLSDQGEIKDLRHKLRLIELERDRVSAKQPELNELRNSLRALETKRREEINDRDRRTAQLEMKLQAETKRRELLESKNQDIRRLFEEETHNLRSDLQEKGNLLKAAHEDSCLKTKQLETNKAHHADEFLQQLQHHRSLLDSVVRQYGILASQSASLAEYNRLKDENSVLQCYQYRLERKLSNSEGQVLELAHLIRQFKEQTVDLSQQLHDALAEINHLSQLVASRTYDQPHHDDAQTVLTDIDKQLAEERQQISDVIRDTEALLSTYHHLKANQLLAISTGLGGGYSEALALAEQRETDLASALASHEAIASRLESLQKERIADQEVLHSARTEIDELRSSSAVLKVQLSDVRQQLEESDSIHAIALKKEKDIIQRLTTAVQKSRMADEALRTDIDRLTDELANAEAYQDAYDRLYDQISSLITRNQIAEEEAERISKLNAEILGHHNPAQRILYVDRIRTELAEAKMKIAELTREQENLTIHNGELNHELFMYKSVRLDDKPRTNITRITRPPLVNLTQSLNNSAQHTHTRNPSPLFTVTEVSRADMTLDEIM